MGCQRAGTGRLNLLDDQLIFRGLGEGTEPAAGDDFQPFLRLELQAEPGSLPDHRIDRGVGILQREIGVAGGMLAAKARNLAAHPHIAERILDQPFQRPGNLRDGEFGGIGRRFVTHGAISGNPAAPVKHRILPVAKTDSKRIAGMMSA